ncbi:MAG: adenylate/guanylate cyclase domain-containing protein, partial [Dehalococcoidia bacterium]
MSELSQLKLAIDALEAQRQTLGDEAVEAALVGLRERIAALDQASQTSVGERKQITVMFADLSGFTALAERTDAEDARNLVNTCFERIGQVVSRYGGYIDKFIGDELMVLFGAPVAMEDHAARALYAALEIREMFAAFCQAHHQLRDQPLSLHFGVNGGLVVAGAIGTESKREYTVIGDPVNVAARLVAQAQAGEILVGEMTRRLVGQRFSFDDLG